MVQLQLHNYNVNNLCLLIDLWQSKTNQWMSMPIDLLGRVNLKYFPPIFLNFYPVHHVGSKRHTFMKQTLFVTPFCGSKSPHVYPSGS